MKALRRWMDKIEPYVEEGGRFEKLYAAYESIDTLLFAPGTVTRTAGKNVEDAVIDKLNAWIP